MRTPPVSVLLIALLGCAAPAAAQPAQFSGHGPVFGMATPTNADGAWAVDLGLMGQAGEQTAGTMGRLMLSYGITEDLQISGSVPVVFASAAMAPARMTGMMPGTPDVEAIGAWRFHRRGLAVGTRVESTAYGGIILPGPQRPAGMAGDLSRAPGAFAGVATGMASRSHYVWGGVNYTRFAEAAGDRRPALVSYSGVWGYRPPALQKDYPQWDWRGFLELTGERWGRMRHNGRDMPGSDGHQILLGPAALGLYRNYGIQAGVQWPIYRNLGAAVQRERFRFAVNFTYYP